MIERTLAWCLENRFLTLTFFVAVAVVGIWAVATVPVDAIPDLTDVQVILMAEWPGQNPQVIEDQITYRLSTAMLNVARVKDVRGYSFFGVSFVYVIFEDGTDIYWARSRVLEYLPSVQLPEGPRVRLGPDATGLGWVYMYTLEDPTGRYDLGELRAIQDWYVAPLLQSVEGVSEVASVGGAVRRYEIVVDPQRLLALGVDVPQIAAAVSRANRDVGGMAVEIAEREYMVRGRGYLRSIRDIENVVLRADEGTPLRVGDVAQVTLAPDAVRGLADRDGRGEVVAGIVVMRYGENARQTIDKVKEAMERVVKPGLPEGVVVRAAYDRSPLIDRAIGTLIHAIAQELIVIAIVCFVFLLHVRSAFVAFVTLPMGALVTFVCMKLLGINANIMSLAGIAIAFGTMVDASIVMVENVHKHIERGEAANRREMVLLACKEVGPGLFFSLLVVTISNLPIFALQDQAGRLFIPLAWTNTLAMAAACLLSITLIPPLLWYFVRGRIRGESENPLSRGMIAAYGPVVRFVIRRPWIVVASALLLIGLAMAPANRLGSEFMPPLEEGDLLYMPTSVPGLGPTEARRALRMQDAVLAIFPEVANVLGKIGRSTTATDTAPLEMVETTAMLHDESTWPRRAIPKGWIARWVARRDRDLADAVEGMTRAKVNDRIRSELGLALLRERSAARNSEEDRLFEEARVSLQARLLDAIRPSIGAWLREALETDIAAMRRARGVETPAETVQAWLRDDPPGEPPLARVTFEEMTREEMQRAISQPGMPNWFLMPIQTRIGMITTGMRGYLGLKVFGSDYERLEKFAVDIEGVLADEVQGTVAALADRVATGGYYLDVDIDREACARYGIQVDDVQTIVMTAIGGMAVTETVEGRYRFPVAVRYPRELRDDPERLARVLVRAPGGPSGGGMAGMGGIEPSDSSPAVVTLGQLARFELVRGPMMIRSENNLLVIYLPIEFEGVSLGGYVDRARRAVERAEKEGRLRIPPGYTIKWSGQYEIMQSTNQRLLLILPLTLGAIFLVLFMYFRRLGNTLIVLLGTLLFAPVGAVWLTHLLDYHISAAWWLGIILLLGLAAETGVIMLVYIENAVQDRIRKHGRLTRALLAEAIEEGAIQRVRPKVMTVVTDAIGIAPLLFAVGAGAATLQRMAAPLVGGIVSSMVLTLVVIPAVYRIVYGWGLPADDEKSFEERNP
jgi:Cu(I)/Ag(I) efflux system membrane protein CusA/SilA